MVRTENIVLLFFCCALIYLNFGYLFAFPIPFLPLCLVILAFLGLSNVLYVSEMHLLSPSVIISGFYNIDDDFTLLTVPFILF